MKIIKCKIDKIPFNYLGRDKEINLSHNFELLADFLADGYRGGIKYEVELPDGKIMNGNHPRADSVFQDTFGCSIEEWREQQRSAATEISIDDLFEGKAPQDINAYHIKAALRKHNDNGENVYVEWNGRKCYSVDAVAINNNFIERATGVVESEYEESIKDKAKYISSVGLSPEEIAKAMVEAHERGLNVYTRIMVPEISDAIYSLDAINEFFVYTQAFYGRTKEQQEDFFRKKEQKEIEDRKKVLEKRESLKSLKATPHPELKGQARKLQESEHDFYFTLEDMAKDFLKRAQRGENVFYNFNGVVHYTCEISSVDDIYKKQYGKSYDEYNLERDNYHEEKQKRKQERIDTLPQRTQELYEKGLPFLDPSVDESEWRYYVDFYCLGLEEYPEVNLNNVIDIMESLSQKDYKQVAVIAQEDPGALKEVLDYFRQNEDLEKIQQAKDELEQEHTQAD